MTVEELGLLIEGHILSGRAKSRVLLDRRGLQFLRLDKDISFELGAPPRGEEFSADEVYLHVQFNQN